MKLLVCIRTPSESEELSPTDAAALEMALDFRERCQGQWPGPIAVDVASLGPASAAQVIRKAFGMGADKGIHLRATGADRMSPHDTARALAGLAGPYDLVLTGIMSRDRMAGQTGPMLAAFTQRPCLAGVTGLGPAADGGWLRVARDLESGLTQDLEVALPCVLTIQSGRPVRYPTLSLMLAGRKKAINVIEAQGISRPARPGSTNHPALELPENSRAGQVLEGSTREKAGRLFHMLAEKGFL